MFNLTINNGRYRLKLLQNSRFFEKYFHCNFLFFYLSVPAGNLLQKNWRRNISFNFVLLDMSELGFAHGFTSNKPTIPREFRLLNKIINYLLNYLIWSMSDQKYSTRLRNIVPKNHSNRSSSFFFTKFRSPCRKKIISIKTRLTWARLYTLYYLAFFFFLSQRLGAFHLNRMALRYLNREKK